MCISRRLVTVQHPITNFISALICVIYIYIFIFILYMFHIYISIFIFIYNFIIYFHYFNLRDGSCIFCTEDTKTSTIECIWKQKNLFTALNTAYPWPTSRLYLLQVKVHKRINLQHLGADIARLCHLARPRRAVVATRIRAQKPTRSCYAELNSLRINRFF